MPPGPDINDVSLWHCVCSMDKEKYGCRMKIVIPLLVMFLSLTGPVMAQTPSASAGSAGNLFLRSGISARAGGFGDAFTAVANDENAIFFNPAGLANIREGAVALNHTQWFQDIRFDNLLVGYNFDRKLGFALSVSHMWMPSIIGKDNFGNATSAFDVSSSIVQLGIGYRIHPSFYLGLGVKYFQDDLAGFRVNGVALDAGLYMYTFIRGLTLGAAVQNIGGDVQYDVARERLPMQYRLGVAYRLYGSGLHLAFDVVKSVDTDINYAAGMEYTFMRTFSLRFGNQFRPGQSFNPGYGAGLNLSNRYLLDYTFYASQDLGNTHRIGFSFHFNIPRTYSYSRKISHSQPVIKLQPPVKIKYAIRNRRLVIYWNKVSGARYNIYMKLKADGKWQKLNKQLLTRNAHVFRKPSRLHGTLFVSVTSIINNIESDFSRKLEVHVK